MIAKKITIHVRKVDLLADPGNPLDCIIARAVRRRFPRSAVRCGYSFVRVNSKRYDISDVGQKLQERAFDMSRSERYRRLKPRPVTLTLRNHE